MRTTLSVHLVAIAACALACLARGGPACAESAPDGGNESLETVIAHLKQSEKEVSSLKGYFTATSFFAKGFWEASPLGEMAAPGSDKEGVLPVVSKVMMGIGRERWRVSVRQTLPRPAAGPPCEEEKAYDGQRTYSRVVERGERRQTIRRYPDHPPVVAARAAQMLNIPIAGVSDFFSGSITYPSDPPPALTLRGREAVRDVMCYVVERATERGRQRWWIAPSRGWRVARMELKVGTLRLVSEVTAWKAYGPIWLPDQSHLTEWFVQNGTERWMNHHYLQMGELVVNPPLPEGWFGLEFMPGDRVDEWTGPQEVKHYVVGSDTSEYEELLNRGDFGPDLKKDWANRYIPGEEHR